MRVCLHNMHMQSCRQGTWLSFALHFLRKAWVAQKYRKQRGEGFSGHSDSEELEVRFGPRRRKASALAEMRPFVVLIHI